MASLHFVVLAAACLTAHAFPEDPLPYRNTIFQDEMVEGGVFENVDAFNAIALSSNNEFRLPTTTRPQHYNVLWTVRFPERDFIGKVDIQLYATQADVSEIFIHVFELNITSVRLFQGTATTGQEVTIRDYELLAQYDFFRVRLLNGVLNYNANQRVVYTLSIDFEAPLRKNMYGIYESWFRNSANEEIRWMASTQFQATWARSAFPCYDEPSFKATFDVTIRRPAAYTSWFCTTRASFGTSVVAGYVDDVYHTTPVMSTYLLALIVAEYESYNTVAANEPLLYEVIARPGAINQSEYAYEVGKELLAEMNDHTAYNFYSQHEYLKMTQAAIPDFGAGAMENWGLLTYREAYLMYDPDHTNSNYKQLIAYILSHEIAHMWFGNLVTNDWWDVLWLNEGFARYYQYFLTDWVEEYMGLGIRFINEQVHTSLLSDSSDFPQPLTNPGVGSPASVSAMFSTISYNKGAAVIRMTEHLLGFNVHRQGLRNYLVQRQYDTALPIHLFQALRDAAVSEQAIAAYGPEFDFIEYYKSWTEQAGHPVLNVQVNHQTGQMTIYQRRFNINRGYSTATTNWYVPITFASASNPDFNNTKPTHVLSNAITVIDRTSVGDEWVIFNKQQTGFYRVNYDDYTWDLNAIALRGPQRTLIHEYNRAQIVNDIFQFARSGLMTYNRAFNLISFLRNETDYNPWVAAITGFNWIRNRLQGTAQLDALHTVLRGWTSTVMSEIGYVPQLNESFMRSYLRYQLAPFVCLLGETECHNQANQQFAALRATTNPIEVPVDSRVWVYCNALRRGTVEDFNFLYNRFLTHNVYNEKIVILGVLGCTPHEEPLRRFLDAIIQENNIIRPQDYTTAFSSAVSGNEENTQIVFQYIKDNLENVTNAFSSVATPLSYISSRLRTEQEIEEFQAWADENRAELGSAYLSVRNGVASSRDSIAWARAVEADIQSYIIQGDQELGTTLLVPEVTPSPVTLAPSNLVEPATPSLPVPDSANTAFLSTLMLAVAFVAHFIF